MVNSNGIEIGYTFLKQYVQYCNLNRDIAETDLVKIEMGIKRKKRKMKKVFKKKINFY